MTDQSKPLKILFCTPHYSTLCHIMYARSLRETEFPAGAQVTFVECLGSTTPVAMNAFAKLALEGNFDYMIQTADDSGWGKDSVLKLLAHDKDVVSGWSSSRFSPFMVKAFTNIKRDMVQMSSKNGLLDQIMKGEKHGLERVYALAGELAAYKVDIFRRIKFPWFNGIVRGGNETTTDDFNFGCRAYDAGVEIWLDWDLPLKHGAAGMITENGKLRSLG